MLSTIRTIKCSCKGGLPESATVGMALELEGLFEVGLLGPAFPPVFFLPLGALLMAVD